MVQTYKSAILDAVASALKEAGATDEDIEALKNVPYPLVKEAKDEIFNVDIAVFGAGAGGLAAAIEAKEAGKNVCTYRKTRNYRWFYCSFKKENSSM